MGEHDGWSKVAYRIFYRDAPPHAMAIVQGESLRPHPSTVEPPCLVTRVASLLSENIGGVGLWDAQEGSSGILGA